MGIQLDDAGLRDHRYHGILFPAWKGANRRKQGKANDAVHRSGVDHAMHDDCGRHTLLGMRRAAVSYVCACGSRRSRGRNSRFRSVRYEDDVSGMDLVSVCDLYSSDPDFRVRILQYEPVLFHGICAGAGLGEKVKKYNGVVDVICLFALVAGMAASLGTGTMTIGGGIEKVFGIKSDPRRGA